jgi:hypothetical protein
MNPKKRGFIIPIHSIRSLLLPTLVLPALAFCLFVVIIAQTLKVVLIGGAIALLGFLAAWLLSEYLLMGRLHRLIDAIRQLCKALPAEQTLSHLPNGDLDALTDCVKKIRMERQNQAQALLRMVASLQESQEQWTNIIDSHPTPLLSSIRRAR